MAEISRKMLSKRKCACLEKISGGGWVCTHVCFTVLYWSRQLRWSIDPQAVVETKILHAAWDNEEEAETIGEFNLGKSGLQVKDNEAKLKPRRPLNWRRAHFSGLRLWAVLMFSKAALGYRMSKTLVTSLIVLHPAAAATDLTADPAGI